MTVWQGNATIEIGVQQIPHFQRLTVIYNFILLNNILYFVCLQLKRSDNKDPQFILVQPGWESEITNNDTTDKVWEVGITVTEEEAVIVKNMKEVE